MSLTVNLTRSITKDIITGIIGEVGPPAPPPVVDPVNPIINSAVFTAGSGGNPATIDLDVSYLGTDDLRVYGVTGTNPVTVTATQLVAGSGGTNTIEFFDYAATPPYDDEINFGLTSSSNSANRIVLVVAEQNNGGASATSEVTVSGLNFDPPVLSAANIGDIQPSIVRMTFDANLFGSTSVSDWTLTGATIDRLVFTPGESTIDLILSTVQTSTAVFTGDLAYSGTGLASQAGVAMATFSGSDVANTIAAYTPSSAVVYALPCDLASMNTASDQTGTVPQIGEQVGYLADLSGNGNHFTCATSGDRPFLRRASTGHLYLEAPSDASGGLIAENVSINSSRNTSIAVSVYSPLDHGPGGVPQDSGSNFRWAVDVAGNGATALPRVELLDRDGSTQTRATRHSNGQGRGIFINSPPAGDNLTYQVVSDMDAPQLQYWIDGTSQGTQTASPQTSQANYGTDARVAIMHNLTSPSADSSFATRGIYAFALFDTAQSGTARTDANTWATSMRPA